MLQKKIFEEKAQSCEMQLALLSRLLVIFQDPIQTANNLILTLMHKIESDRFLDVSALALIVNTSTGDNVVSYRLLCGGLVFFVILDGQRD